MINLVFLHPIFINLFFVFLYIGFEDRRLKEMAFEILAR